MLWLPPQIPCRLLPQPWISFKDWKLIHPYVQEWELHVKWAKSGFRFTYTTTVWTLIKSHQSLWFLNYCFFSFKSAVFLVLSSLVSCTDPFTDENVLSFKIQTECLKKPYLCLRELVSLGRNYKSLSNYMNVSPLQV